MQSFEYNIANSTTGLCTLGDTNQTVPYTSRWVYCVGNPLLFQVTGTATFSCQVQRLDRNPSLYPTAVPAPADVALSGSATSFAPVPYNEPGIGWWRVVFTTISGGYVDATFCGFISGPY